VPSIRQRLRERASIIPGVIAAVVVVVWGIELTLRGELNWGQAVWLVVSAGLIGLASLLALLPLTLALDGRAAKTRFEVRLLLYVASCALLGLGLAMGTGALHPVAALLGGGLAGALLAKICAARASTSSQGRPR
jgi:hypothetical protein